MMELLEIYVIWRVFHILYGAVLDKKYGIFQECWTL